MNKPLQGQIEFEAAENAALDGAALVVDLDGYEGPLHVLLALARRQKVDLLKLSITRLADQYLDFIRQARAERFELAAEYLVMAAWLAFLKSRLLLPRAAASATDETTPEAAAAALGWRLAKLDMVRRSVETLNKRALLGRDVFVRGDPEALTIHSNDRIEGDLFALVSVYAAQRRAEGDRTYRPAAPNCYRLDDARERLREMAPRIRDWARLTTLTPRPSASGPSAASLTASTFSAGLELVREGDLDVRQAEPLADLYLRARRG
jgi:segregation and condensation protein A